MGVSLKELQQANRFVRIATAGVVAYAAALPLLQLYRIVTHASDQRRIYAVAATACYLLLEVWLVLSAARDARGRGQGWALVALAVVSAAMVPVIGVNWLAALYGLAALVLVIVGLPWSLLLFAALAAAPVPVTLALGHPEWASYYALGVPVAAVPLVVVVWLIRLARRLQAARVALAQQAVVRERLRIDGELRRTVGNALEAIAGQGVRAGALAASDPSASARELRGVVAGARRTLAEARRMVTDYQEVSLRAELQTAAMLLSAVGIRARLVLPPGGLPDRLDVAARAALRRDITSLLRAGAPMAAVTITVVRHDGRVQLELGSGEADPPATEVTAR